MVQRIHWASAYRFVLLPMSMKFDRNLGNIPKSGVDVRVYGVALHGFADELTLGRTVNWGASSESTVNEMRLITVSRWRHPLGAVTETFPVPAFRAPFIEA